VSFLVTFEQAFAWTIVILAGAYLAGLRSGERTRRPRIELKKRRYRYRPYWER
jgi:hypothetical protein